MRSTLCHSVGFSMWGGDGRGGGALVGDDRLFPRRFPLGSFLVGYDSTFFRWVMVFFWWDLIESWHYLPHKHSYASTYDLGEIGGGEVKESYMIYCTRRKVFSYEIHQLRHTNQLVQYSVYIYIVVRYLVLTVKKLISYESDAK